MGLAKRKHSFSEAISKNPHRFVAGGAPIVPTGNWLIEFEKDVPLASKRKMLENDGRVASAGDVGALGLDGLINDADAVLMERIGVAVVKSGSGIASRALDEDAPGIKKVLPEFFVFAHEDALEATHEDLEDMTWGIDAIGARNCDLTGRGIKLGILDTGFDISHSDFAGRTITRWSAFGCACDDVQGSYSQILVTAGPVRRRRLWADGQRVWR